MWANAYFQRNSIILASSISPFSFELIVVILCFTLSFRAGFLLDKQYNDLRGNVKRTSIPKKYRRFFYIFSENPPLASILLEITAFLFLLGVIFYVLLSDFEIVVFDTGVVWILIIAWQIVELFVIILPFAIVYHHNLCVTCDMDLITTLQRVLSICPKRKCKIVGLLPNNRCIIMVGILSRRRYTATTEITVTIGDIAYAIHHDDKPPYWRISQVGRLR